MANARIQALMTALVSNLKRTVEPIAQKMKEAGSAQPMRAEAEEPPARFEEREAERNRHSGMVQTGVTDGETAIITGVSNRGSETDVKLPDRLEIIVTLRTALLTPPTKVGSSGKGRMGERRAVRPTWA